MTNHLVGDVYAKIIEEVVAASANDFEESGVGQATLSELQREWQHKLSQRQVAQMPWDPKPEPPQRVTNGSSTVSSVATNGIPTPTYPSYENEFSAVPNGISRIKPEPGNDNQYQHMQPNSSYAQGGSQQGGMARAQQLVQQQFGAQAAASLNTMQRGGGVGGGGGGLALPGQQAKQQGLQLPGQNAQQLHEQYSQQQRQTMQRQQQQLQQQQNNPRIKVENNILTVQQGQLAQQQRPANTTYGQTDGADENDRDWNTLMAHRHDMTSDQVVHSDTFMRDRIASLSDELQSGLLLPLDEQVARLESRRRRATRLQPRQDASNVDRVPSASVIPGPSVPQLDGDLDDEEDVKDGIKLEDDDDDAINSDLDDPDDDQNHIGDDDDELGDSILCTYDKVQRVKNKWKCTLKDGVLNTGGKEWLFHKGQGEFEW